MMYRLSIVLVLAVVLAACGEDSGSVTIEQTRTVAQPESGASQPEPSAETLTSAERFGFAGTVASQHTHSETCDHSSSAPVPFIWDSPEGWQALPSKPLRTANFRLGTDGDTECYLTILTGLAGGVAANANRWRGQIGLDALSDEAISQLPTIPMLGGEAVFVEAEGTFGGMTGDNPKAGSALLGAILTRPKQSIFVKMVGSAETVKGQRVQFKAFCKSLRSSEAPPAQATDLSAMEAAHGGGLNAMGAAHGVGPSGATSNLAWAAPATWKEADKRAMRVVTFVPSSGDAVECYVTVLKADGGGLAANVNRWRQQMGLEAASADDLAALPTINVLGQSAPLVSLTGHLKAVGDVEQEEAMLLGTVAELEGQAVFVKMTGPAASVEPERARFVAFCESLKLSE